MPTGYTYKIGEGISFEDFVLNCARAFGACFMQRDEDSDIKPKLQKVDDHHLKELEKIKEYENPSKETFLKYKKSEKEEIQKDIKEKKELLEKYKNMLRKVSRWIPPSKKHEGLKEFMKKQIQESIDFDCNLSYQIASLKENEKLTYEQFCKQQKDRYDRLFNYHSMEHENEISRTQERNEWIISLYNSLGITIKS